MLPFCTPSARPAHSLRPLLFVILCLATLHFASRYKLKNADGSDKTMYFYCETTALIAKQLLTILVRFNKWNANRQTIKHVGGIYKRGKRHHSSTSANKSYYYSNTSDLNARAAVAKCDKFEPATHHCTTYSPASFLIAKSAVSL